MVRVLSLTTIYPNAQNLAEGRSVALLDRALARRGITGTTLVLRPYAPYWLAQRRPAWSHLAVRDHTETADGLRVFFTHYWHLPARYSLMQCVNSMTARAAALIRQHKLSFDVVHAESIYPAALAAQRVAARWRKPFVITLRDDLSHLQAQYGQHKTARRVFQSMFAKVSAVFVIGPALERDAPKFFPDDVCPPVILAPNGIDARGLENLLAAAPPPPTAQPWGHIVSVGNLFRIKGIHENLRALQQLDARGLRRWRYTVVGDGPYRPELQALARELGVDDRVTFRGRLPHPQALAAIRDADIFCLPSWAEPFGNVYAEAAVCGRPAIGCWGGGAEILIRDGETGLLVPPRDVTALAGALGALLTNEPRARAMGDCARQAIGRFTWQATAQIYADILERLPALSPPAG